MRTAFHGLSAKPVEDTPPTTPNAPSGLGATSVAAPVLTWTDNSNNEITFRIERKTGAGGTYAEIASVSSNVITHTDTTASVSTTYFYRVRARNGGGDSAYATEASATTPAGGSEPSSFVATTATDERIDLTWTNNSSYDSIRVERKIGAGAFAEFAIMTQASRTRYSDWSVRPNTAYTYRIRTLNGAVDSGTYSAYSNEDGATSNSSTTPVANVVVRNHVGSTITTAYVDQAVLVDTRGSTNVSGRMVLDDTSHTTIIDFGDGSAPCFLRATGHIYRDTGSFTITVTVKNGAGTSNQTTTGITISNIPAATGGNIRTATEQGSASANRTHVQGLINAAAATNTVEQEVVLPASMVIDGTLTLPAQAGTKFTTIRSANISSLTHKRRVSSSNSANMPTIRAMSSVDGLTYAVKTTNNAAQGYYRFQGIHFAKDSDNYMAAQMAIGEDGGFTEANFPHDFIIDRCWYDGGSNAASVGMNGLRIYANGVSVVDSYLGDFRRIASPAGPGVDTAAIGVVVCRGPIAIVNNTLVATGENYNSSGGSITHFATISSPTVTSCTLSNTTNLSVDDSIAIPVGGATTYGPHNSTIVRSISGNNITFDPIPFTPFDTGTAEWSTTPGFVQFTNNYMYKPVEWASTSPHDYQLKNLWEIKFGRYYHVDGNYFFQSYLDEQPYPGIIVSILNQSGGESHASVIRQIQFTNNLLRNLPSGWNITGQPAHGPSAQTTRELLIENNLLWNVGGNWQSGSNNTVNLNNGEWMSRFYWLHNTVDMGASPAFNDNITDLGDTGGCSGGNCVWKDSVHQRGQGQGFRDNFTGGINADIALTIRRFLPTGGTTDVDASWDNNLIHDIGDKIYPANGVYPTGAWGDQFTDYTNKNFILAGGSPGKSAATDGTDMGVNVTTLTTRIGASSNNYNTATFKVATGDWS